MIADLAAGESTPDPSTPDSPRLRAHLATPDGSSISGDGPPYTPSRLTIAAVVGGCILLGAGLASLGAYRWGLWGDTSSEDRVSGEESDLVPQQLPVPLPTGSTGGSAQPPAPPAIEPRNDNAEPSHLYPDSAPR